MITVRKHVEELRRDESDNVNVRQHDLFQEYTEYGKESINHKGKRKPNENGKQVAGRRQRKGTR